MATRLDDITGFLNVDLDVYAKFNLRPLAAAFGKNVVILYAGREIDLYSTHLALARQPKNADTAIRDFAALINGLPRAKRKLWDTATIRDFNIGVQSKGKAKPYEVKLTTRTMKAVSSLNARVVVTVYAADRLRSGKAK